MVAPSATAQHLPESWQAPSPPVLSAEAREILATVPVQGPSDWAVAGPRILGMTKNPAAAAAFIAPTRSIASGRRRKSCTTLLSPFGAALTGAGAPVATA